MADAWTVSVCSSAQSQCLFVTPGGPKYPRRDGPGRPSSDREWPSWKSPGYCGDAYAETPHVPSHRPPDRACPARAGRASGSYRLPDRARCLGRFAPHADDGQRQRSIFAAPLVRRANSADPASKRSARYLASQGRRSGTAPSSGWSKSRFGCSSARDLPVGGRCIKERRP